MNNTIKFLQSPFISYSETTLKRAERALSCGPFALPLWTQMRSASIPLPLISGRSGVDKGFTVKSLTEAKVESELNWLIQVGLLRREVDGQGITDSFRLTPLGKQIVQNWEKLGEQPKANWWERCQNQVRLWLAFSI
ncbi:MAG: Npun_F0494 family protein [Microcystaceae cyanobacterium]